MFNATVETTTSKAPAGEVLDSNLLIACRGGTALRLTELQREGKKKMSAEDFLKGFELKKGKNIAV